MGAGRGAIIDTNFRRPLSAHPHDPDIRTVLRICNVHNVAIATNLAAADLLLASPLLKARQIGSSGS